MILNNDQIEILIDMFNQLIGYYTENETKLSESQKTLYNSLLAHNRVNKLVKFT